LQENITWEVNHPVLISIESVPWGNRRGV